MYNYIPDFIRLVVAGLVQLLSVNLILDINQSLLVGGKLLTLKIADIIVSC